MILRKKLAVAFALLVAGAGFPLAAAEEALPKAETILDKYIEVTGGKAAYEKLHSEVSTGTMELAGKGIKGSITSYRAEPALSYTAIEIEGIGKIEEGSDGNVAWTRSAIQGPRIKEGEERSLALVAGKFNGELHWRETYTKTETTGVETVNGQECYKVVLTPKEGRPMTRYYDKKSNLMVKTLLTVKSPMGEFPVESTLGDYRKEGELLVPHSIRQTAAGQEIAISIETVKPNAEIPKGRFDLPDDIRALLKK